MMKKTILFLILAGMCFAPRLEALEAVEEKLEALDRALVLETPGGFFRSELSGLFDTEVYYVDQAGPGLIFGDESFIMPRLTLFVDTQISRFVYGLLQARFDRGFDPRVKKQDARLDEYLIRVSPFGDGRLNLQFGKFATAVGNWVSRHDSWQNPFINAPLPYENVTIINDATPPSDPVEFLHYRDFEDRKRAWVPMIWGPVYATGWSVSGRLEKWNYAVELKNANLSSRPSVWRASRVQWEHPTVAGRLGYHPNEAWSLGTSFAIGAYLQEQAASRLPPGKSIGDYLQTTIGQDFGFSWRRWQIWGEVFWSQFEVPNVEEANTAAYYLEAKYKLTYGLFLALRWNQQFFDEVDDGRGGSKVWDRNIFRIDSSLGYRLTRHLQLKAQYSYSHQKGEPQQGENLAAFQATLRF